MESSPSSRPQPSTPKGVAPASPTSPGDPPLPAENVRLPLAALRALAAAAPEAGPGAVGMLREAGRRTGEVLFQEVGGERDARELAPHVFVRALNRTLRDRGLGSAAYAVLDPGMATLSLASSPESPAAGPAGCAFASGWIAGLLSRVAEAPVAVMEVRCAGAGDGGPCRFLVGAAHRLRRVHRGLQRGQSLADLLDVRRERSVGNAS